MTTRTPVLFINSPYFAGADTWVHLLVLRNLDPARFERHVAAQPPRAGSPSPNFEDVAKIPGIALRPTDFGPSLSGGSMANRLRAGAALGTAAFSLAGLVKYIRDHRIQILHSTDRPRDAIACVLLGKLTGAKSVVHVHVKFGDWMSRGVKWAFGQADALIGISEFVSDSLVAAGYDRARVHTILNSVDLPLWDPDLDPAEGRRSLGVPADAPLLVSVARLFRWKGHEELVRAIALVQREIPDVRLAIVGADDPQGVGTAAKLADLARELGISGNVALVGHRRDIAKLLAACDIFALPSFEEPFGLVFAEAMAMKRPVVALDNGGTPEVVTNGETGLLAPPADVPRLAEHILTLIRDPSLRKRMGELGRRRVEARFTPERIAADIATLYTTLLR